MATDGGYSRDERALDFTSRKECVLYEGRFHVLAAVDNFNLKNQLLIPQTFLLGARFVSDLLAFGEQHGGRCSIVWDGWSVHSTEVPKWAQKTGIDWHCT